MMGVSGRLMIEALIAGERDRRVLAELAKGRLRVKDAALIEALTGRFDEHHAELADMLLQQIDGLTEQIERLDVRVEQLLDDLPDAQAPPGDPGPDGNRSIWLRPIVSSRSPASADTARRRSSPRSGCPWPCFLPLGT